MSTKVHNKDELNLIPNKHVANVYCTTCNNYYELTGQKARQNIKRNGVFICKNCTQPKATTVRPERQKEEIKCCNCDNQYLISRENINRNKNKNGKYLCQKCASNNYNKANLPSTATAIQSNKAWSNEDNRARFHQIMSSDLVKSKISKASIKKWENTDYANNINRKLSVIRGSTSIQLSLYKILESLNIKYYEESEKTCFGRWAFDCLVPIQGTMYKNLLIECQGDYWHELAKKKVNDRQKFTLIDRYFPEFEIMYLWEHEFLVESRIIDRLKLKLVNNQAMYA